MKLDNRNGYNIFVCWLLFIIKTIGYLLLSPKSYKTVNEVLVVLLTANNRRSIQPILDSMRNKNYTYVEHIRTFLPLGKIYLKSLLHAGEFIRMYRSSTTQEKRLIRSHFNDFASAQELYKAIGEFYEINQHIKLLIVSNDHEPIMRSFILQAKEHSIKTFYSQHASVSEYFPPLEFDYSFLDGEESFKKYQMAGKIEGNVFLVGSPRFDVITHIQRHDSDAIGVAFNEQDSNDKILSLIMRLRNEGFKNIVVRPHPHQDRNHPDWSIFTNVGCEVSHPLEENPFVFISRISFLIAGVSSIHLEAALLRIPSVIYSFQTYDGNIDYYGYAKMKLTPIATCPDDVVSLIRKPYIPGEDIIRYYDATFGTKYNGKSAMLAAQFIDSLLEGKDRDVLSELFVPTPEGYFVISSVSH